MKSKFRKYYNRYYTITLDYEGMKYLNTEYIVFEGQRKYKMKKKVLPKKTTDICIGCYGLNSKNIQNRQKGFGFNPYQCKQLYNDIIVNNKHYLKVKFNPKMLHTFIG